MVASDGYRGHSLTNADFRGALIIDVDVTNADLSMSDFSDATLINVNFEKASSLKGMIVNDKTLERLSARQKFYLKACIAIGYVKKQ